MQKIDLKDITFLIPVRLDSIDRLENLLMVLDFLTNSFDTNVHVLEASSLNNQIISRLKPDGVYYEFVEDRDPVFFRTFYINKMVKQAQTPYLAIWDADVICPVDQLLESAMLLRKGKLDVVYPYRNKFLDMSMVLRGLYMNTRDMNMLLKNRKKMKELYAPVPVGGAFMVNRIQYVKSGMENLSYYGWGIEDGERLYRWHNLGYSIERADGVLFHLTHERGINSRSSSASLKMKRDAMSRTIFMSKSELNKSMEKWDK